MATPLQHIKPNGQPTEDRPRTVLAAKSVDLALITYIDDRGQQQTQLGVVGDNNVHLLESRVLGISKSTTPQGVASEWLSKGVFEKMGKKKA